MPENKIPQKGGYNIVAEKDFFSDTESAIPKKPEIPHKPAQTPIPQKTAEEPPQEPHEKALEGAVLPQLAISKKDSSDNIEKKPIPERFAKPFENISEGLVPLRTYRQDVAGVMRDKKTSLVQLVLEEQRVRNKREQEISPTSRMNLPLILLSVIFLFSTIGLVYYIYFHINPVDRTLEDLKITPLILVEKNKETSINERDPRALKGEIVDTIQGEQLKVDAIEYFFFTETLTIPTPDGTVQKKNLIPSDRFFEALGIKMPPMLLRSLRHDFMFGIHSFNKNQPFLILKTDYYDNAFAGMLEWETKLSEDILPLFGRGDRVRELSQRKWGDTVIKNKDTRVLRNFDGSIALVYAFKDQRTLIITTNEDTLLEVSRRIDLTQEKRPE
jgi:hypothetical protein